jgi:hypothetical protein
MPDDAIQTLILDEIKSMRAELSTFSREHEARVSVLEAGLYDLRGNGRPGRVERLETSVQRLKQRMWWAIGAGAGASSVISVVAWVVMEGKK